MDDWKHIREKVHQALLKAQATQKKYADRRRRPLAFETGAQVLLSTKNLRLKGPRKLQDRFVGPFTVMESIGKMAYKLDL